MTLYAGDLHILNKTGNTVAAAKGADLEENYLLSQCMSINKQYILQQLAMKYNE